MGVIYSNLGFLMDYLNVTGKDIATFLDIDKSLVSKWKNNQRPLSLHTSHLDNLVKFFLEYKSGIFTEKIDAILSEAFPGECITSSKSRVNKLSLFLTSPLNSKIGQGDSLSSIKMTNPEQSFSFCNFSGNEGRREAVDIFLDKVLESKIPQELLLISQEEMSWLTENPIFIQNWRSKLMTILQQGHKIKIIHWVDRSTKDLGPIVLQWIPLYLTGNITSWYLPRYSDQIFKSTIFTIKNKMTLLGMEGDNHALRYTSLFKDAPTLNQSNWIFNTLLEKCKPLVKVFNITEAADTKKIFSQIDFPAESTICACNFPGFHTMPQDLFKEILTSANLEKNIFNKCMELYKKMQIFLTSPSRREMYSKDFIRKSLAADSFIYKDLYLLSGVKVTATQKQIVAHLKHILNESEKKPGLEVALIDEIIEIDTFLSQDKYIFAWSPEKSVSLVLLTEPNVVEAFYYDYTNLWENIPTVNRDPKLLRERIDRYGW